MIVLPLIMIIGGCDTSTGSEPEPQSGVFKPGTYTAEAQGRDTVTLSVLFSANAIKNVTVIQHKESTDRDEVAIALSRIPSYIALYQTLSVDVVSGATLTSNGILAAVEDCVRQAGGDAAVADLKK
ncbi:MAG: FMN-binding protein [Treponema sp.]|nr:FMN-binding protein [Treponema sp.]